MPATADDAALAALDLDALRTVGTILLLGRTLDHLFHQRSEDDGLSITELSVLGQVHKGNALPSIIARQLRLDPGRITRLADRLVALDYLRRFEDEADRRRCLLQLTSTGQRRLERGRADLSAVMNELLDGLPGAERDALIHSLASLRTIIDER